MPPADTRTTYTPGPWKLGVKHPTRVIADSLGGMRRNVAFTALPDDEQFPDPIDVANARLIAAAPEMAELLEATDIAITNLLQIYGEHAIIDGARAKLKIQRDRIRALLARIEGEP